ncbi:RNA polymerase subunit sigma [Leptolyngbya sp. 'hensonii']|uniref:sigma-70 family RNA polymerase sigma factor n=1 Tax=Leptolyngbya sp. 'hensonii' TaxID=1922337 RepID=UPI00094FA9BA|nr:sigma-70 family RNA polymerase sigma factor [Leptolyngbya sp. 'hensonii']OLP16950.1 RNA polymerase subunit sigma [Leptolyngbya sp. 'hensonii']
MNPDLDSGAGPTLLPADIELIRDLKARKADALGLIYDRYASLVYRLALRILLEAQEAEDLTQEVFLYLWQSQTYNPDRGSLGSFLTTMTRSRAIDRLRSRNHKLKVLQQLGQTMATETPPITPFEAASLQQRSHYVQDALLQLPEKQRQILELAYYNGLSQSEIAAQLGLPLGTVKTWSRQGLLSLRKHLQTWID